jgi:hypothetical protein
MGGIDDWIDETCSLARMGGIDFGQMWWEDNVEIKMNFKGTWCEGVDWIFLAYLRYKAESCKKRKKQPIIIKCWRFLD